MAALAAPRAPARGLLGAADAKPRVHGHQRRRVLLQWCARVLCAWRTAACQCLQHFCAVHGVGSAAGRARDVEGVGVRVQELVMGGLVRVRCVAVRRVRLAGDRVVEGGCRSGAMEQRGGEIQLLPTVYSGSY